MNNELRVEKILQDNGFFLTTTVGTSMWPLFQNRRDEVLICPVIGRLKRLDVPLFRYGGKLILHRIVKVSKKGYVICGDNCWKTEKYVTDDDIVGVLTAFYRNGTYHTVKEPGYRLYSHVWAALYPIRWFIWFVRRVLSAFFHLIKKKATE